MAQASSPQRNSPLGLKISAVHKLVISAKVLDELEANDIAADEFGRIAYSVLKGFFVRNESIEPDNDILELIQQGRWTFLFDKEGRFIENSI